MSDVTWQPIETAPRDGSKIDLWVVVGDVPAGAAEDEDDPYEFVKGDRRQIWECYWQDDRWMIEWRPWRSWSWPPGEEYLTEPALKSWERATHWKPTDFAASLAAKLYQTGACRRKPQVLELKVLDCFLEESSLDEFDALYQAAKDKIPPECRSKARVKPQPFGKFIISYTHEETADEVTAEIQRGIEAAVREHGISMDAYERLRSQFSFLP
jgi:hypothetical protein